MVQTFLEETCIIHPDGRVPKFELFLLYRQWLETQKIQMNPTSNVFARDVYAIGAGRIKAGKQGQKHVFKGIYINPV